MKLQGVRVLDLSLFLPGPMLTLMLADHGADVIKVEAVKTGEPTRHIGYRKNGESVWFRNTHRGKRSLQVDLKSDEGREIICRLAADADIFVEAFRPGVVQRLGLNYDAIKHLNAKIVYCSISAFGQSGDYAKRPAHDLAVQAMAGVVALNEGQDGQPTMPHMPVADALASLSALSGVLMALVRARDTGHGDYLDVSMLDSVLAWTPNVTGRIFATGTPHNVKEERSWGGNAMYNIYQCADKQWIALGGAELKFAHNLLSFLGRPDLEAVAALPPGEGQAPLRRFFTEVFATRSLDEWCKALSSVDVAFAPVRNLKQAFEDPVVVQRQMLQVDRDGNEIVGTPIRFMREPANLQRPTPALGEHTLDILSSAGYSSEEIESLLVREIVAGHERAPQA